MVRILRDDEDTLDNVGNSGNDSVLLYMETGINESYHTTTDNEHGG